MSASERNPSITGAGEIARHTKTQVDSIVASEEFPPALHAARHELAESLQINSDLLQQCYSLTETVSSLELTLASARQLARHDLLTGLPDRQLLRERFIQAAALATRHHQQLALLFFDMSGFKRVNDRFGRTTGDKLLQEVGKRLSGAFRESDTVCRYGDDEFVVLLTEIDYRKQAVKALKAARELVAAPYVFDGYSIRLTVRNGVAFYPGDGQHFAHLMQLADRSMFSKTVARRDGSDVLPTLNFWLHGKI